MLWDLHDLAAIGDLARERGMSSNGANNWRRFDDFPKSLVTLSTGPVYSRRQVWEWQRHRWPEGQRTRGGPVRRAPEPISAEPLMWDLDDLVGPGDIARRYDADPSTVTRSLARDGAPRALLMLSTGAVYSDSQVAAWWSPRRRGARRATDRPAPKPTVARASQARPDRPRMRRMSYHHITDDMRARIRSGEWAPGSRLPSRAELATEYDVGVRIMAHPIAELVREGLLTTVRASGTYVTKE